MRERRRREEIDAQVAEVQGMLRGRMAAVAGVLQASAAATTGLSAAPQVPTSLPPSADVRQQGRESSSAPLPAIPLAPLQGGSDAQGASATASFSGLRAGSMWDRLYRCGV